MIGLIDQTGESGGATLYRLKITLKSSKPPIWRRVVVRSDIKLDRLHQIIQLVMGWTDSHLHQFIVGRTFYGRPDPEFADMGPEMLNEKRFTVADLAPATKKKFIYEYDFGDGWQHDVLVEKVLPSDAGFKHPVCLGGANACPPEDCGGIWGYYNLLETLADPKHAEHEEMKNWLGGEWHAKRFELEETNEILKRMKA
jgi:hypothetical protein